MDLALIVAGTGIVAIVGWDIALTLLHPAARGPLSYVTNRGAWRLVHLTSRSRQTLSFAGPLAMGANMVSWVAGLWFGFALIYASEMDLGDALYLSGEALTTVGFGHEDFGAEWQRYVAVFEAAGGLGAFTAAIAYVLSVYPLVTQIRATALYAALSVEARNVDQTPVLTRRLIESHEHVRRFPVLYYFESGDEGESIATLLKATARLRLELGDDKRAEPLERAICRLLDDLESDFIGGRSQRPKKVPRDGGFRERAERVIGAFAKEHRQDFSGLTT